MLALLKGIKVCKIRSKQAKLDVHGLDSFLKNEVPPKLLVKIFLIQNT